jgi:hypothetical protein
MTLSKKDRVRDLPFLLRADRSGVSDLPLRLLAGSVASAILLVVAFNGAQWLERQEVSHWARGVVDQVRGTAQRLVDRPGSVEILAIDPPTSAHRPWLRLTLLDGRTGPLAVAVEDDLGVVASAIACKKCVVELAGAEGGNLVLRGPGQLQIASPSAGALTLTGVAR